MKLGKLFKAIVDTATIPLSVAADAVTLGNSMGRQSYTKSKIEKIAEELDDVTKSSDDDED
jgi:hypothetical protein